MLSIIFAVCLATTNIEDGSLLFVENGSKIVQRNTDSTLTHVAIVLNIDGEPWVYEATKPKVRKIRLVDFYSEIDKRNQKKKVKLKVWIATPNIPFNNKQKEILKSYLDSQLGRKYSIISYVGGEPTFTIHCCEIVGNALKKAGVNYTDNPCTDAPVDVWKKTKLFYEKRTQDNL